MRLFNKPNDYTMNFIIERNFRYDPDAGLSLQDLTKALGLNGTCEVIYPIGFRPAFILNDHLDTSLLPMLIGNYGYLRVIKKAGKRVSFIFEIVWLIRH